MSHKQERLVTIILIAFLLTGCGAVPRAKVEGSVAPTTASIVTSSPFGRQAASGISGTVFALLADNHLVAIRAGDGTTIAERSLAPAPSSAIDRATGHFLAINSDGSEIFVLLTDDVGSDRVVALNAETLDIRLTLAPGLGGDRYRSIAVGPTTGRLYLFGNRGADVIVAVLDPGTGAMLNRWVLKAGGGYDWSVYQGGVIDDERTLIVSYHGRDTTGIDTFSVTATGVEGCRVASQPNGGCIVAHGGFMPDGADILVATGTKVILRVKSSGTVVYGVDTRLEGNHLMEFAVDRKEGLLYAVGSCGYTGGFSVTDLATGAHPVESTQGDFRLKPGAAPPRVLIPPRNRDSPPQQSIPCGERLTLGPGALVVVAKTKIPVAKSGSPGALLFLDGRSGRVFHTYVTTAEPLDVLIGAR